MKRIEGEIIVGYDDSESARDALRLAWELAEPDAVVTVVHAFDVPKHVAFVEAFERASRAESERIADSARDVVLGTAADVRHSTVVGKPADVLADVARERDAALIVVGSRGLGAVRAAIGSVTHRLLHDAPCPILVVPDPRSRKEAE